MRQLNICEVACVSGGKDHNVVVIDPVAAVNSLFMLNSIVDRNLMKQSAVTGGMIMGAISGGILGYQSVIAGGYGVYAAAGASLGGAGLGLFFGGLTMKVGANFAIGAYDMIMG